jgi:hypothetical protein
MYVLEGELVLRIGDERHTAPAGTFAFVPRETVHGFHNAGTVTAALLVVHHPAGFEQFLAKVKPKNKLVDDAKFHLGEILSAQGDKKAAQANFKAVAADAKSNLRKEAQGRLGDH